VGVVVNRFRGDLTLFADGIGIIERLTGVPVLGVVPWLRHGLDEEDRPVGLPVDAAPVAGRLNVAAVLHPRVANTDDLTPLLAEEDVAATWVTRPDDLDGRDVVILPGTKATVADLLHHTSTGMAAAIRAAAARGTWILGLCGGYQMLGQRLDDPGGTDGPVSTWPGLGLLPVATTFAAEKVTATPTFTSAWPVAGLSLTGYEIHHGRTQSLAGAHSGAMIDGAGAPPPIDGQDAVGLVNGAGAEVGLASGRVAGAYLHGLLGSDDWRHAFLDRVRADGGLPRQPLTRAEPQELRIDRWARHVRGALRPGAWERLLALVRG
jgi:adenosylcobyric acid synthase